MSNLFLLVFLGLVLHHIQFLFLAGFKNCSCNGCAVNKRLADLESVIRAKRNNVEFDFFAFRCIQ